jgi:guanylate kinase
MANEANEQSSVSPGILLVLSAPSGAGKTTLARRLEQAFPAAQFSVSYTTRSPRGSEREGVDYHFVEPKRFEAMIHKGEFVEWAEVYGQFYGSGKELALAAQQPGGFAVYDIDVQGGQAIKRKFPSAVLIFVLPPSMEELERRLRSRATDSDDVIARRMLAARAEIERGTQTYDYLIINDDLERAFSQVKAIVFAEQSKRGRVDLSRLQLSE